MKQRAAGFGLALLFAACVAVFAQEPVPVEFTGVEDNGAGIVVEGKSTLPAGTQLSVMYVFRGERIPPEARIPIENDGTFSQQLLYPGPRDPENTEPGEYVLRVLVDGMSFETTFQIGTDAQIDEKDAECLKDRTRIAEKVFAAYVDLVDSATICRQVVGAIGGPELQRKRWVAHMEVSFNPVISELLAFEHRVFVDGNISRMPKVDLNLKTLRTNLGRYKDGYAEKLAKEFGFNPSKELRDPKWLPKAQFSADALEPEVLSSLKELAEALGLATDFGSTPEMDPKALEALAEQRPDLTED
jgi:hypothetical protein